MIRMLKTIFAALVVALLCAFAPLCSAQQVVDKMVATVNAGVRTDLITYSDLLWQLALQPSPSLLLPSSHCSGVVVWSLTKPSPQDAKVQSESHVALLPPSSHSSPKSTTESPQSGVLIWQT